MKFQHLSAAMIAAFVLCGPVAEALAQKPASPAAAAPNPQSARSYKVVKGDTLLWVAARTTYPGVNASQMAVALYDANPGAFFRGNINLLIVGQVLAVPSRETARAVDAAQAGEKLRKLAGARAAAPVVKAAPPPARTPVPVAKPAKVPAAKPGRAAERFRQGEALEGKRDLKAAFDAYTESAEAGYGPAQKKLGDLYGQGNAFVTRDYATSLKWYQKARDQGVEVPTPKTYPLTQPR
jgi:pilus assembly protein FimV